MGVRRIMGAAGASALLAAGLVAVATPASAAPADRAEPAQFICGFFVGSNGSANYGHCDEPPRTDVVINVRLGLLGNDGNYDMCVKPGVTVLGKFPAVSGAAYTGRLCWAG